MDKKYKILIPLMIAGAMNTVDTSAMNVTMPTFAEYFNLPLQTVSWISSTYLLGTCRFAFNLRQNWRYIRFRQTL